MQNKQTTAKFITTNDKIIIFSRNYSYKYYDYEIKSKTLKLKKPFVLHLLKESKSIKIWVNKQNHKYYEFNNALIRAPNFNILFLYLFFCAGKQGDYTIHFSKKDKLFWIKLAKELIENDLIPYSSFKDISLYQLLEYYCASDFYILKNATYEKKFLFNLLVYKLSNNCTFDSQMLDSIKKVISFAPKEQCQKIKELINSRVIIIAIESLKYKISPVVKLSSNSIKQIKNILVNNINKSIAEN